MDESMATVPRQYKAKHADMSFATADVENLKDPNAWQSIGVVGPCVFAYGLTISQKLHGAACTVQWEASGINGATVTRGRAEFDPITIEATVRFGCARWDENEEAALRLPLAQKYEQIRYLRLSIQPNKLEPSEGLAKSVDMMVGHLKALLTGIDSEALENNWRKISTVDHLALEFESQAQQRSLGEFTGCRIRTRQGRNQRFLLVDVYRGSDNAAGDNEGIRYDPEKQLGQSYVIHAPSTFPVPKDNNDEVTPQVPPILGAGGKTSAWVLDVAKETDDDQSGAVFIGLVKNSLGASLSAFLNKEEDNVSLVPIFNDVQGDRAHVAISKYSAKVDFESQSSHGFYVDPVVLERPKSKIAAVDEFLGDFKCDEAKNTLAEANIPLPADLEDQLNPTQAKVLEMASGHSVSILHGPPGTGKSWTLAAFIRYLVVSCAQKVAGVAVQNVAVDALLDSCVKLWKLMAPGIDPPFVRGFSEGMIFKQWADGETAKLKSPYHLHLRRQKMAAVKPKTFSGYLKGCRELEQFGRIDSPETMELYLEDARTLTRQVLGTCKAFFCTAATCRSPMFHAEDKAKKEPKFWFPAKTIVFDEASMLQRPHLMLAITSFIDATQILLAGDPRQLSGLIMNKETRSLWPDSFLLQFMQNGFPWIMLDEQYRMHDELYAHLIASVYNAMIGSKYLTANPSPFLRSLLEYPTQVTTATGDSYVLNSFLHFIDVEDGQQESKEAGSSWNDAEIEVMDALVRGLLGRPGVGKGDIMVIVGYKEQKKLLKKKAKDNGWLIWVDIKWIGTIDSTQGSQAKIVCLGLVTTHGLPHFMGDGPRANVATSRQQEALYIVGKRDFWFRQLTFSKRKLVMHDILAFMDKTAAEKGRSFVVSKQGSVARPPIEYSEVTTNLQGLSLAQSTPPTAIDKGKGREIDLSAVEKARRNLAEVEAAARESVIEGENMITEEVKRFRQAEESRLEQIRIQRGLDEIDEEFQEMEEKSHAESKRMLKRLEDEQDELHQAFVAEISSLRITLWEEEVKVG
ncbi:MAG: hypothetical protein Q9192_004631 [Flavoplaca navasiana]